MKGYFRFSMINDESGIIDSSIIFGDIEPIEDFVCGLSYYVENPSIHCRFVQG